MQRLFYVGTNEEVAHHAAPLESKIDFEIVPPERIVSIAKPGDLAVFYSEHFDRFRQAIVELKKRRVGTLYMIDGILEWRNAWVNREDEPACPFAMRPILSHKVACIGKSQKRVLDSWGNGNKTEVVGIPRLESLRTKKKTTKDAPYKTVMVLTAKCPAYTPEQEEKLLESLLDVKQVLINRSEIRVVWRLTNHWHEKLGVVNSLVDCKGQDLANEFELVDAVIGTPSTALLESMLADLPTAILDYNGCPQYVPAAWTIQNAAQIKKTVDQLLSPSAHSMDYQRYILSDSLFLDGNAIDQFSKLVEQMFRQLRSLLKSTTGITFPANLLSSSDGSRCLTSSHQSLFPNHDEFGIEDKTELQTQLAHSRREIEFLKRELAQSRNELSQAHRIFEEIHRHPIAGPIVRIRQQAINWLKQFRKQTADQKGMESRARS